MKTKIQNLFIALAWLVLPALVQAQFTFTTNNGAITITGYNTAAGLNAVIPAATNGYPVTSIGDYALGGPGSVTIPGSVTNIADDAFEYNYSLTNIAVAAANPAYSSLGGVLFDKAQVTLLEFPGGLGGSYTITNSVASIGNYAFDDSGITSVTIPNSVTTIGNQAFSYCTRLTSVTIPGSVTRMGDNAFEGCGLTNVTIDIGVTSIGDYAFVLCSSLASVTFPNSVTSIGTNAFYGCSLTNVTIPASVTRIADGAFGDCTSLTNIAVDAANPAYSSLGGVLFDKAQATLLQFPGGLGGSYTITNSVTSIGVGAFEYCFSLTNVTIPDSVTSIGDSAFLFSSLTSVTIPNSVTSIGDDAFAETSLTSVTIPNSVTSIGVFAFTDTLLTNVTIPNSVTSIGVYAFASTSLTSVTIPGSVTSIGDGVFEYCYNLTSVTIPNSVTSIGNYAFDYCSSLTSVTLPNSVTSIGVGVFEYCSSLTSVTIPASVTSVGDSAFLDCSSLTSVTLPNSVTSIGDQAFYYCTSLTGIYFQGNSPSPTNDSTVFSSDPATVYYLPGTTGWGAMFDGQPTAPWFLPNPQILNFEPGFGIQPGGFGFTISWATNVSVVVEAATNLANPVWLPVSTNPLTNGTSYFSDPQWTNYPERFYRAASAFTVGGTLAGLPAGATVTLQDNGGDNLTLSNNGTFTFPTALPDGQSYSVTGSGTGGGTLTTYTTDTITANGSGTISGTNVTNVAVRPTAPALTGDKDLDMLNAAVADGTAHGGVPGVMPTEDGGPIRVTAIGTYSYDVCLRYQPWSRLAITVGNTSCSSTTFPSGTPVIEFGTGLACGGQDFYGY